MSNNRKTYSFKSVGQLNNQFEEQQLATVRQTPVGIITPISFANSGGTLFSMNFSVIDQIRDNLKNLLLTDAGGRLMLNDFGCSLGTLVFEATNEDVTTAAISRISRSVGKYMPFVELQDFETRTEPSGNDSTIALVVRVTYSVPSIGATNQAVEAVIYAAG